MGLIIGEVDLYEVTILRNRRKMNASIVLQKKQSLKKGLCGGNESLSQFLWECLNFPFFLER